MAGTQPSSCCALLESVMSVAGSPGRRSPRTTGIGRPVTRSAVSITSCTEARAVPRL